MNYVLSVPHTGSRTMLQYLGCDHWEHAVDRTDKPKNYVLLHFGYDDERIHSLGRVPVHIPVRDPLGTLVSWYHRKQSPDRCIVRCMAKLVEYVNPEAIYYRLGDLPGHLGKNEKLTRDDQNARRRAEEAWNRLATPEIREFYERYKVQTGPVG